ncbi:hypothetical protein Scep_030400 [Stephania cephalantha]|uniref:Uncharacterized protein n=1 Tax=Stephania cephalantha TaxID=152367 RepID=A0AAP0DZJ1_9MAGN
MRTNTRSSMGSKQDNWERWRNHLLAPEVRGDKASSSFWLHRTTYLGSSKCLIP